MPASAAPSSLQLDGKHTGAMRSINSAQMKNRRPNFLNKISPHRCRQKFHLVSQLNTFNILYFVIEHGLRHQVEVFPGMTAGVDIRLLEIAVSRPSPRSSSSS